MGPAFSAKPQDKSVIYALMVQFPLSNGLNLPKSGKRVTVPSQRNRVIYSILDHSFALPAWVGEKQPPFETLVKTIISQNTNDRNRDRAFQALSSRFQIIPSRLARADSKSLEKSLRTAGLYRNKANVIKKTSIIIEQKYHGDLNEVLKRPLAEARSELLSLPGVGFKTADILLLFSAKRPTLPVDTHVYRVSRRLGLAPKEADVERVRLSLQDQFTPESYLTLHVKLIELGRTFCKARHPACQKCPMKEFCPSVPDFLSSR